MLLAVNLNFVAFSHYLGTCRAGVCFLHPDGGGSRSAGGLAILVVVLFRNRQSINVDELDTLKG